MFIKGTPEDFVSFVSIILDKTHLRYNELNIIFSKTYGKSLEDFLGLASANKKALVNFLENLYCVLQLLLSFLSATFVAVWLLTNS